jgi:hypothetical protein
METAYTFFDWLYIPAIITALVVSLVCKKRTQLYPIKLYIIISLFVNIIIKTSDFIPSSHFIIMTNHIILNIYSIVEIGLLYYFIYGVLKGKKLKKTLIIFFGLYLLLYASIWIYMQRPFFLTEGPPFGFENLLISVPCLFVIYEYMNSELLLDFKSNANFIIICGMLFYFSITTPFYFGYSILENITPRFFKIFGILNFAFYSLLFVSFTKAYLCPLPEQKH